MTSKLRNSQITVEGNIGDFIKYRRENVHFIFVKFQWSGVALPSGLEHSPLSMTLILEIAGN
jgi:hypothetical protein